MPKVTWLDTNGLGRVPPVYRLKQFASNDLSALTRDFFPGVAVPDIGSSSDAPLVIFTSSGAWRWNRIPIQWPSNEVPMDREKAIQLARQFFIERSLWDEAAKAARVYTSVTRQISDWQKGVPIAWKTVAVHVTFRFRVKEVLTDGPSSQMEVTFAWEDESPVPVEAFRFWRDLDEPLDEVLRPLTQAELDRTILRGLEAAGIQDPVTGVLQLAYLTAAPNVKQDFLSPVLVADLQLQQDDPRHRVLRFYVPAWQPTAEHQLKWFGPLLPLILPPS
ncbi:MAG: hypothetical protein ABI895_16475 [Deltaproteobacteria bacterium]